MNIQNNIPFCGRKHTTLFYSDKIFLIKFLKLFLNYKTKNKPLNELTKHYPVLRVQTYNPFSFYQQNLVTILKLFFNTLISQTLHEHKKYKQH